LTDVRADLEKALAAAIDAATWSDALKDEAIRQALHTYSLQGPAYEVDLPVTVAGHEQSLAAIANLLAIECVAYPWSDGLMIEDYAVRWRRIGPDAIRIDRQPPQVGETLRIRYRQLHAISGLDGAATTTVAAKHRAILATGAATFAATLRLRQMSENPAVPQKAADELRRLRDDWDYWFTDMLERLSGSVQNPVWARIGL
jgi:hypothetical protein